MNNRGNPNWAVVVKIRRNPRGPPNLFRRSIFSDAFRRGNHCGPRSRDDSHDARGDCLNDTLPENKFDKKGNEFFAPTHYTIFII